MKMRSFAKEGGGMEVSNKPQKYYPSMNVSAKNLPELEGYNVNDTCTITVKAKLTRIEKYGNGEIEYRLDLISGGITEEKKAE